MEKSDRNGNGAEHSDKPAPKPPPKRSLLSHIPPWITEALHNRRAWKNFARSLLAVFIMTVMMVANKSLKALGSAAFFGLIAATILPPSMPLAIYLFALITMGIGMLVGWAWGCAAMASGLHVRSKALLQAQSASAQATFDPNLPSTPQMLPFIFKGHFLDPRASAVTGVFLFLGCYFLGWIRARQPKMVLMTIFASILLDLMCTFGPLFPVHQYMLASNLMKPAAAYMAVGIVCTILFFPQTLNHLVMGALVNKTLKPLLHALELEDKMLSTNPSDREAWTAVFNQISGLNKAYLAAYNALAAQSKMLQLEISHGRISAGQLGEVINKTRDVAGRALGLSALAHLVEDRNQAQELAAIAHTTSRALKHAADVSKVEKEAGKSLEDLIPILKSSTADLRSAAQDGLQASIEWLDMINNTRWKKQPADFPSVETRQAKLHRLREALYEFRNGGTNEILAPFENMFNLSTGQLKEHYATHLTGSSRGLFRCFTFTSTLVGFCTALIDMLELLVEIELGTPKNKFQFPGKFVQEVVRNVSDGPNGEGQYTLDIQDHLLDRGNSDVDSDDRIDYQNLDDAKAIKEKVKNVRRPRDPDAGDPTNWLQRFGRLVAWLWQGARGDNGIFALKYGIVSVGLWVPAVCSNSAEFYYMNRGLWALIMAQTGLGVFAGEQLYNFLTRMVGTLIGAVVGMVAWYIGAQKGIGGPYGVTAAAMVVLAPFMFLRVVAPMQSMAFWIMVTVTITFIVGYSWVDMHLPQTANQGVGASLAGRRALLVVIGFAGGLVMVLFPHPISAKVVVRQGLSKNIAAIGELFGLEVAALERSRDDGFVDTQERRKQFRSHFLRIFGRLAAIQHRIGFASLEPDFRGPWPKDLYLKLLKIQNAMLASTALLSSAYSQLEPEWCARLTDDADLLHPAFTADIFALFTILRHSLRQGEPLPPLMPIFERLVYHNQKAGRRHRFQRVNKSGSGGSESDSDTDTLNRSEAIVIKTLKHDVTWQTCHEEQFTIFATALIAIAHLVGGLNKLHATVLELVGERDLEGFDAAQERWARAERLEREEETV